MIQRSRHHDAATCNHVWERRADLDARRVLRFVCAKCGVIGHRGLSPKEPVRVYPDLRTRMPEEGWVGEETPMSARQRFFKDPSAVQDWLERRAWREMFAHGERRSV